MTKLRLTKIEAVHRQIDAAIRMTFANEDPVAIHSVATAGQRMIRDVCESRGDVKSYLQFTDWIAPGHEKEFWSAMNKSSNFIKHADNDPHRTHDFNIEASDFVILLAIHWYRGLGRPLTIEMHVFTVWWMILHPKYIKPQALTMFEQAGMNMKVLLKSEPSLLSRDDRLKIGMAELNRAKESPPNFVKRNLLPTSV